VENPCCDAFYCCGGFIPGCCLEVEPFFLGGPFAGRGLLDGPMIEPPKGACTPVAPWFSVFAPIYEPNRDAEAGL